MSLLYRILYAAHANGTHHKLALQGVRLMGGSNAEQWRSLFLSQAEGLLEGSKAPDKVFKDFQNHCLHVADDPTKDWGGACQAAENWYRDLVQALACGDWSDAAYSAGVLSHYYTDPLMPFHTGSSDAEAVIHRAAEWSVNKSFETLWAAAPTVSLPPYEVRDGWVSALVRDGACASHAHYQTLIDDYDFDVGAKEPEKGFGPKANKALSALLAQAAAGFARLLERACAESGANAPEVSMTVAAAIAGLKIPVKWVTNKIEDASDRAEVLRIYAELQKTGALERNLPEESREVRHALGQSHAPTGELRSAARKNKRGAGAAAPKPSASKDARRGPRLLREDEVEKAPSIGPKTAARLKKIGVVTVGDLLDKDPKTIAKGLDDSRINAKTTTQWRDQALLLTRAPGLKTAEAVMLAACGYRDLETLAAADPATLTEQMVAVAAVDPVKRSLRGAKPPETDRVNEIVDTAKGALEAA